MKNLFSFTLVLVMAFACTMTPVFASEAPATAVPVEQAVAPQAVTLQGTVPVIVIQAKPSGIAGLYLISFAILAVLGYIATKIRSASAIAYLGEPKEGALVESQGDPLAKPRKPKSTAPGEIVSTGVTAKRPRKKPAEPTTSK